MNTFFKNASSIFVENDLIYLPIDKGVGQFKIQETNVLSFATSLLGHDGWISIRTLNETISIYFNEEQNEYFELVHSKLTIVQ